MKAGVGTTCVHSAFLPGVLFSLNEKIHRSYGIGCQQAHWAHSIAEQRFLLSVLLLKEEQSCSDHLDLTQMRVATVRDTVTIARKPGAIAPSIGLTAGCAYR